VLFPFPAQDNNPERILRDELQSLRWTAQQLEARRKGDPQKATCKSVEKEENPEKGPALVVNKEPNVKFTEQDKLIMEARARIMWGEAVSSVRDDLTSNGVPEAVADEKIEEFILERNREIQSVGLRSALTGLVLVGAVGGVIWWMCAWLVPPGSASVLTFGGYDGIAAPVALLAIGVYGVWKLVRGIIWMVRPQREGRSVPDMPE
jgi:hypothetical protein